MGEAAVSGGDCRAEMEREAEVEAVKMVEDGGAATVVRWERFLPRMVLRVLLVESDDSTRQIIAALLRKCSYKVAAVGDGLKAWELLKGKPQSIDLILTEVDLPSISGFALLTLIMEHDICKNTPVIMMSSNDSVSTVYKCMLRGAADFLVKPVRINELRNLWQHVWRRQAMKQSSRSGPQDDSVAQQKVEATAENNAVSTPSSGYVACVQRNKECIEKGSDAQSSCTKPDMEVEMGYVENIYEHSQTEKIQSPASYTNMREAEECVKSSRIFLVHDNEDTGVVAPGENVATIQEEDVETQILRGHANAISEACNNSDALVSTSRKAIDFIGAFNDPPCNMRSTTFTDANKNDCSHMLDLSLRRSHPSGSVNQVTEERRALNHSDASAFSRYVNKVPQPLHSPASICNRQRDYGAISDRKFSDHTFSYNFDTHSSAPSTQKNMLSSPSDQSRQAGVSFPSHQQTVSSPTDQYRQAGVSFPSHQEAGISIPIPMRGVRLDGLSPKYGSVVSSIACKQSEPSPVQSPGKNCHPSNVENRNTQQVFNSVNQNIRNSTKQAENYQRRKLESSEDGRYLSSATDQSASSNFCNGTVGHFKSTGCGNSGSFDQTALGSSAVESGNNEASTIYDANYQRSLQREAALTKFRLKRKERCFEKKVRYESRKKLAEQRPRIKGQFVRHTPASVETDSQCGNSLDC